MEGSHLIQPILADSVHHAAHYDHYWNNNREQNDEDSGQLTRLIILHFDYLGRVIMLLLRVYELINRIDDWLVRYWGLVAHVSPGS